MSEEKNYNVLTAESGVPIKAWTKGVPLEDQARKQLLNVAQLPFIFKWVAAMPDVHWGIGATVGSVIPTKGAIIPAAVGVDIGCGMMAVQTDLNARDLPDNLKAIRNAIEQAVPHGRTNHGGKGDVGAWQMIPARNAEVWQVLKPRYEAILEKHPKLAATTQIIWARWARAITSSKFASTKRNMSGSCCTAAPAGSAIAWAAISSNWRVRTWRNFSSTCRIGTWRIFRKVASILTITSKPWNGPRTLPASTAT
jgi:hypothetical protein